ncbi:MAG TPA: GSU2403 family nucleotidyltransferase fold protein [Gammaproteobacteria bacterium]|nr:GSU2403 family nucleotidyltransferase fold protein [Gammaproteobacteria bacterium]
MDYLPETTRLLYAQLLSQCLHGAAPSGRGLSFVSKRIKGSRHWYLQLTVGSRKTQHYLGPDTVEIRELIGNEEALWQSAKPDLASREQLVSMLIEGGAFAVSGIDARLFEVLERAGVFLAGGTLVGSHVFAQYGNMLGVRWSSELTRTQDVDLGAERHLAIGMSDREVDLRRAIMDSELGFVEVPALDRGSPSTRFRIRGRQLSVDLLTPMQGRTSADPVHIRSLNAYAEPVRYLEYVLEDVQAAVIVAKAGLLINVPSPARFAFNKLVIANRRSPAFQSKALKDIDQAEPLLRVLLRDRPGDLRGAWRAALEQPRKFVDALRAGFAKLSETTRNELEALIRP